MSSTDSIYTDPFILGLQQFPMPELPEDAILGNLSGEAHPSYGLTHSEETIKLMSKPRSEEGKHNMSISRKNYYANNKMSEETIEKLRILSTGRLHTAEACEKMKKIAFNKKPCPHCGQRMNAGNMANHIRARHS